MSDKTFLALNSAIIALMVMVALGAMYFDQSYSDPTTALKAGVEAYCTTFSKSNRLYIRDYVNSDSPHKIAITCQGD